MAGFAPCGRDLADCVAIKTWKPAPRPFPKRTRVGTQPSRPPAFAKGCLLRKP